MLIADEMGLGKSFQALSHVAMASLSQVLILCPNSLKHNWADELAKHYGQITYTIVGSIYDEAKGRWRNASPAERAGQWAEASQVKIANYDLLTRDTGPALRQWDLVIADECTYLKSYKAARTKAAKKLRRKHSLGLSGAPVENNLEELHSIMDFCMPGLLGNYWTFRQQHMIVDHWGGVRGYKGLEQVKSRIKPHYLRRLKKDVLTDLPEKYYNPARVEMSAKEWALYDSIEDEILADIKDNPKLNVSNILTKMLRLKQLTSCMALLGEEGPWSKINALDEILEASAGHKIVAFTFFEELVRLLVDRYDCPFISGKVNSADRQQTIRDFQTSDAPLLVSTDAGAYGLTITSADIIVHIDQLWNPAKMLQREDRLHRIGQKNAVQVVNLLVKDTVDERVREILHTKQRLADWMLDEENPQFEQELIAKHDLLGMLRAA